MLTDFISIISWWLAILAVGIVFFPLTARIFYSFSDKGYLFSKVLGLALVSYTLFLLNVLHIFTFSIVSIVAIIWVYVLINYFFIKRKESLRILNIRLIVFEEVLFLIGIIAWSYVRAHEPSLNGLEKFMDFGFLNSILRTTYQPAVDMWFPPLPINYYYFGHLVTAVVTKLSFLPSNISYNLMLATLFAFCFTLTFSLASNIISKVANKKAIIGGLLTAALISCAGNLHTIYSFFKAYSTDHPVPFWTLQFLFDTFPNGYWYPNATRFIPFTIHEFPLYSFVVSDLHGHVLDIPFVLLLIALAYVLFITPNESLKIPLLKAANTKNAKKKNRFSYFSNLIKKISPLTTTYYLLIYLSSFLLAVMYMTNVWDGLIYMLLIFLVLFIKNWDRKEILNSFGETAKYAVIILILFFIFSLPFNFFFRPFASGVGVLCAPEFLTKIGKIGPLIFESAHCQRSQWWELATLYGFFYFFVISFLIFIFKVKRKISKIKEASIQPSDVFILVLIFLSTLLIIIPELIYVKDIYPQHYRANTMFKLVYQAFIMLSISSGFIIARLLSFKKNILYIIPTSILLGFVFLYTYFAVNSYYNSLGTYSGIDGTAYLKTKLPEDYDAINWFNKNVKGRPVIVEAQGDSYTDYERISANTGLPTILGWTVHEWLWRGTYDIPAPRIVEVQNIYQSANEDLTKKLLNKYNVEYVYVGNLEREKYPQLIESKFQKLGRVVFEKGNTRIYKVN